jgi:hypothetical protein
MVLSTILVHFSALVLSHSLVTLVFWCSPDLWFTRHVWHSLCLWFTLDFWHPLRSWFDSHHMALSGFLVHALFMVLSAMFGSLPDFGARTSYGSLSLLGTLRWIWFALLPWRSRRTRLTLPTFGALLLHGFDSGALVSRHDWFTPVQWRSPRSWLHSGTLILSLTLVHSRLLARTTLSAALVILGTHPHYGSLFHCGAAR